MSVSGLCDICDRPDVDHTCDRCGRLVCGQHFEEDVGLCIRCAGDVGQGDDRTDPEDLPDGVDTYRF